MDSIALAKLKGCLSHISRWQYLWLAVIVLFTLVMHFSTNISQNGLLFDERYYVTEARTILAEAGTPEPAHPPLGKLFVINGIRLFGDNPFGWRFFPILFGTASIVLFYFVCRRLQMSNRASILATFLFGLENLSFVQSSVAMLDVYSVTFMLVALLLYLRGNYLSSGICIALSTLAKLTGALGLAIIFLHWLITSRRKWQNIAIPVLASAVSFLVLLPLLDYALISRLINPLSRVQSMLGFAGALTSTGGYSESASLPWGWLLDRGLIFYAFDPQYIAVISPMICVLIIPAVIYMLFKAIRRNDAALFGLLWFAGTYLVWIPLSMTTHRFTYIYYFYPAVGAVCIGLGAGLSRILDLKSARSQGKTGATAMLVVTIYLVLHFATFILLSPLAAPIVKWFPAQAAGSAGFTFPGATEFLAQLHFGRAGIMADRRSYDQALEKYASAIEYEPDFARAYASRGRVYADMERYPEALAECDKAITMAPDLPDLYAIRAEVYLKMRLWDKTIADCDSAIALHPLLAAGAYLTRGAADIEMEQYQPAIADCSQSILLDPRKATSYNTRGIAYGSGGQFIRAAADFSKAIEVNPEISEAYFNRGITYQLLGEKAKAIADLNKFIGLSDEIVKIQEARQRIEQLNE